MDNGKIHGGLEALAGEVPPLPAKASSPVLIIISFPRSAWEREKSMLD
jgi:hypothetical protein